jgi:hypothetical protein
MNKREKILAVVVGALLVCVVLFVSLRKVDSAIQMRRQQMRALEQQVNDKQRIVRFSQAEADRMTEYERRSLPSDVEKARTLYQSWLVGQVRELGFDDPQVDVIASRKENDVYHTISFAVNGRADLKQLVNFLYNFYSADYLHRIRRLHAKRLSNTRQLDVSFSIDALSLPTASSEDQLHNDPKPVLEYDLIAYWETILGRNLSGPPNTPPVLDVADEVSGHTNQPISFKVSGKDPDGWDRITYGLDGAALPGAELHPEEGRFAWQPQEPGEYELVVTATDDGFPAKTTRQTVRINVTDPPPPQEEPEPVAAPKPSFDRGKFAFLTAITEAAGQRQAWISLRTEGKLLKLFEGQQFDVGEVNVTVARIDDKTVELDAPVLEQRWFVHLGQSLEEARQATSDG